MTAFSYIVEVDKLGTRRYKDSKKTLTVWGLTTCADKITGRFNDGGHDALRKLMVEMADWMYSQTDEMHREWAYHCQKQMEEAYDKFMEKQKPAAPAASVINLFDIE